ncbi:hypothetical protein L1887_02750 [Cichorium endivia]|nr:hypothetical protein L1887_02750 [Cichorium endivia]
MENPVQFKLLIWGIKSIFINYKGIDGFLACVGITSLLGLSMTTELNPLGLLLDYWVNDSFAITVTRATGRFLGLVSICTYGEDSRSSNFLGLRSSVAFGISSYGCGWKYELAFFRKVLFWSHTPLDLMLISELSIFALVVPSYYRRIRLFLLFILWWTPKAFIFLRIAKAVPKRRIIIGLHLEFRNWAKPSELAVQRRTHVSITWALYPRGLVCPLSPSASLGWTRFGVALSGWSGLPLWPWRFMCMTPRYEAKPYAHSEGLVGTRISPEYPR